jgi:hypothetical protein
VTIVAPPAAPPVDTGDPRSDYQAAENVGTLEAWDLFLARHPIGFFANLAREQRAKLLLGEGKPAAEAARKRQEEERKSAAARKAEAEAQKKRADEERQRVERERAQREQAQREQAQREEAARNERERLAREKEERERAEREKSQREELARLEREKARREEVARVEREQAERAARREEAARAEEEQRRLARERAEREKGNAHLAMLPPAPEAPAARPRPPMSRNDLILAIKRQLRRVGCFPGKIDENWGDAALTRSIAQFVKQAKFSGATDEPTYDFLDAVSGSGTGACALECGRREVARNGRCVPNVCPPGQAVSGQGECIAVAPRVRR